jgi:tight adherence protein B
LSEPDKGYGTVHISEASGPSHSPERGFKSRRFRLPVLRLPGLMDGRYMENLKLDLIRAGVPLKPEEAAGLGVILAIAGFLLGGLIFRNLIAALCTALGGFVMPRLWIVLMKKRRSDLIENQLLSALVMIANSLRAGHSFMQGLELVMKELDPPLGTEFGKLVKECRMGLSVEDALTNMVNRVDSNDLELAVTGVLIQRQVGGNLARVLDNIASTIDKRFKTRSRIRVATAQGRISAWVVTVLPFALGALVFGAYPEFGGVMLTHPLGLAMLAGGSALLAVGVFLVRKVVNIDV